MTPRWWERRPDVLRRLERTINEDATIVRLDADDLDRSPILREVLEAPEIGGDRVLAYVALAVGPYGTFRLVALFPVAPDAFDPLLVCLDGPMGGAALPHRNGPHVLCLYHRDDHPDRKWKTSDGIVRLMDLGRQHLFCEHRYRGGHPWPIDEASHGATSAAPADASLRLPPPRTPARNEPCSCGSGVKAKRCCYR
jgi:hypothetical protein